MEIERFSLHIDSMAYGGRGVGRRGDGKVVFVDMAIPGETVRAFLTEDHKSYALAEPEELIEVSPHRVSPPCPLFYDCGGCDWQHIAYLQQVVFKQDILLSQVRAGCPREKPEVAEPAVSAQEYGYRTHTIVRCSHEDGFRMGFYRKKSNIVVPFDRCLVLNELIQEKLDAFGDILRTTPLKSLASLEIHAPREEVLVRAMCRGRTNKRDMESLSMAFKHLEIQGLSYLPLGERQREYTLGTNACCYELPVHDTRLVLSTGFGGFIQANSAVNEEMVSHVAELAKGSRRVLDLYCGNGNFTLALSLDAEEVMGMERDPGLVRLAKANAGANGLTNVRFSCLDVVKGLSSLSHEKHPVETVVLDPPREGAKEVVQTLAQMKPDRIIYISCNPSTLSRDLATLIQAGYTLRQVRLFDMFPQTYHIESVSYLLR